METYYVTQEQLNLIVKLKYISFPLSKLTHLEKYKEIGSELDSQKEKALLRYIG